MNNYKKRSPYTKKLKAQAYNRANPRYSTRVKHPRDLTALKLAEEHEEDLTLTQQIKEVWDD